MAADGTLLEDDGRMFRRVSMLAGFYGRVKSNFHSPLKKSWAEFGVIRS
jgi:hypothetical protein